MAPGGLRLHAFERAVLRTVRRRALWHGQDGVLVALSGGADSSALLAALAALRDQGLSGPVWACHVDHQLRPGSSADGDWCEALCGKLRVPLERVAVSVRPGNVQGQARRARYAALEAAARRVGAVRVATAHSRGDQAETVLLRLLRGSGARGLAGIPPRRGVVARPLLDLSREQVVAYLEDRGLGWCEDPTNATRRFLRNRIRLDVVPLLSSLNPSLERALAGAADLLREDDQALESAARAIAPAGEARATVGSLREAPVAVRRRAVRRLWKAASGSRRGLEARHVESVLSLLDRRGPGRVTLPRGFEARCAYGELEMGPEREPVRLSTELAVPGPGVYPVPGSTLRLAVESADPGGVAWPLELRARRAGDRIRPDGGCGEKKLGAWLIDHKVPRQVRDRLLLVCDGGGRVLWIPELGVRGRGVGRGGAPGLALLDETGRDKLVRSAGRAIIGCENGKTFDAFDRLPAGPGEAARGEIRRKG